MRFSHTARLAAIELAQYNVDTTVLALLSLYRLVRYRYIDKAQSRSHRPFFFLRDTQSVAGKFFTPAPFDMYTNFRSLRNHGKHH